MEIEKLKEEVLKCDKCDLHKTKTKYVFGEGSVNADILFIGEAPGANEDAEGKPFVGRAGDVLSKVLKEINLKREDIYICNILKCRPPSNRNPKPEEIKTCTAYLNKQIEAIKPKILCTLGNFATHFIMKKYGLGNQIEGISKLHGKIIKVKNLFDDVKIIPIYHPAMVLYNPYMINALREDFKVLGENK